MQGPLPVQMQTDGGVSRSKRTAPLWEEMVERLGAPELPVRTSLMGTSAPRLRPTAFIRPTDVQLRAVLLISQTGLIAPNLRFTNGQNRKSGSKKSYKRNQ